MDRKRSAQDVLRCNLCETPNPQYNCDICHINLCKKCAGEHLLDESKEHKVVPIRQRGYGPDYPTCLKHTKKQCELHCEQCDLPICAQCVFSDLHLGHKAIDIMKIFDTKKEILKNDLEELKISLIPKYHEIAATIPVQKAELEKHSKRLTTALCKRSEEWHREIDEIINNRKTEINQMQIMYLAALNKQKTEITQSISLIAQRIVDLKKLLDSYDVYAVSAYKSKIDSFRKLPPYLRAIFPSFSSNIINTEYLQQQFGKLSAFSIESQEYDFKMESSEAASPSSDICRSPLLNQPKIITTIDTNFEHMFSVTCSTDEQIWTRGDSNIIKLYNLQGELLESIRTKSGNDPRDITVSKSGHLVYSDFDERTVNIVMNKQISEVIRLRTWRPLRVNSTVSGDLLVTMVGDKKKRTKVVRCAYSTENQTFVFDSKAQPLYFSPPQCSIYYVTENKNLDVCVVDGTACAMVVVNEAGKLRFKYTVLPRLQKNRFIP
nr:tripartite motif-containing protein 45-like [Crassostrea gigas]